MFFDLQFTQAKFLELLQDQVQRALPLVTDEFDNPIGSGKLMIDHLECSLVDIDSMPAKQVPITGPGGPTTVAGNVLKVKITVDARLTSREKVLAAGHFGAPELQFYQLWVKAEISARAAASGDIQLAVTPVEIGDLLNVLSAAQKAALLAKMPAVEQSIALPDVAGHTLDAHNAGLTLHDGVVAVRAELSNPNGSTVSEWTSFFAGNFTVLGNEWAIRLPPELLVEIVDDAVTEAVDAFPEQDPSIEIIQEPQTSWGLVGANSKAIINAVDACPVGDSDIEVELDFAVGFALANGKIQVTISVTWDLDDWDVFRCAVATIVLPGAIIGLFAGALFGPIGAIVVAVLTIIGFIVAVVKISDTAHGQLSDGVNGIDPGDMNLHTVEQDDSHAVIRGEVALGSLLPGMTPTVAFATPLGLIIGGTLAVPAHHERSLTKFLEKPFDWGGGYSCSKHAWAPEQWEAQINFGDPNHYPLATQVELLTVPASTYTLSYSKGPVSSGINVLSAHSTVTDGTGAKCELLIRTNSGIRYANLGHLAKEPAPPSPEALLQASINCLKPKLPGPKKWLEAHWLVDPAPYEGIAELQVWDLVASRLVAGTAVEVGIVDRAGHTRSVGMARADRRGQAAFRLITRRGENVAVHAENARMALFAGGAVAQQVARFTPWSHAIDATVIGGGDQARVAFATKGDVMVFGLDGRSLGRASIPGVQHVVAIGSHLAIHDRERVAAMRLSPAALAMHRGAPAPAAHAAPTALSFRLAPTRSWTAGQEITALVTRGGQLVATLRDGTAVSLDRHLTPATARTVGETWLSEPALAAPLRVGSLIARVEGGAVAVYRYRRTAVF